MSDAQIGWLIPVFVVGWMLLFTVIGTKGP
jgi:hypothetical protein